MSIIRASHYSQVDPKTWPGRYFSPKETADRGTGEVYCDTDFLLFMDALREEVGQPLHVNSWFRSTARNANTPGAVENSAHTEGCGADIKCSHDLAWKVFTAAIKLGCKRIGVRQHGDSRFVHVDMSKDKPSPRIWSYA